MAKKKKKAASKASSQTYLDGNDILKGLCRRPDLFSRQVGFDLALYDASVGKVYLLNAVAAAVWYHITPGRTVEAIAQSLRLTFSMQSDSTLPVVMDDVRWFIRQIERSSLLMTIGADLPPARVRVEDGIVIPDRDISQLNCGYVKPTFKAYTLQELKEMYDVDDTTIHTFADTYKPDTFFFDAISGGSGWKP